jgi:putative protease
MELGIDALKIEGRMKGVLYLASIIRIYRQAIDRYWERPRQFRLEPGWMEGLQCLSHRPYTQGMLFDDPESTLEFSSSAAYLRSHTLAGVVRKLPCEIDSRSDGDSRSTGTARWITVEVRSRLVAGMQLEFLYPDGTEASCTLSEFRNLQGESLSIAHPNNWIQLPVCFPTFALQVIRTAADCKSRVHQDPSVSQENHGERGI